MGESIRKPESEGGMLVFPEQLSIKANRLRDEFERLRSADSDDEDDEDADAEDEDEDAALSMPEMSSADRRKIFVETRRLVFAPINYSSAEQRIQHPEKENEEDQKDDHSVAPWHQNPTPHPVTHRYG